MEESSALKISEPTPMHFGTPVKIWGQLTSESLDKVRETMARFWAQKLGQDVSGGIWDLARLDGALVDDEWERID